MIKYGKAIVKLRIPILILAFLLLIPSVLGMLATRVNYDVLVYLPSDIETMKGQDILMQDFGKGAFAMLMVQGMDDKDVAALKDEVKQVDGVDSVLWYNDIADISIPKELIPQKYYDAFNNDDTNTTLMAIFFNTTTSTDKAMNAVKEIRQIGGEKCFLSGMSAVVEDTKELAEKQEPIYVLIAVVLATLIMSLFLDSWLLPIFFLASIGLAVMYNMGTNIFMGQISYLTKALAAVLQLAVTMDYSIFLWHSYEEQKLRFEGDKNRAMAHAIKQTITSIVGSSITTVAGFAALCFMSFTLGFDIGIVMAKGVLLGVISCVTILPAMILVFDKALVKTKHKPFMPKFDKLSNFIIKHYRWMAVLFIVLLIPALWGYTHTNVYYNLDRTLPKDLESIVANTKLQDDFDMSSTHMLLCNADMKQKDAIDMCNEMEDVDGVKTVVGFDSLLGNSIPEDAVPSSLKDELKSGNYQLILISSKYKVASDAVNNQITKLNEIAKKYDSKAMLIGEAPCTKDLITITNTDFNTVSIISIAAIIVIILLVLQSVSLPIILVAVIELAIFINMGIPYYTNTTLPFIASVVIGTIQLGSTVDYAILMTTRYKRERSLGGTKQDSITIALKTSIPSIVVSALGFFAATFGVGIYSTIDMISSLCILMARGAVISMFVVIFILPSMFMLFDKLICKTSIGFLPKKRIQEEH